MQINTIPKDFIINVAVDPGRRMISNFLLHGLKIKNDSKESMLLEEINFMLYAGEKFIKQITYREEALELAINDFAEKARWLGEGFGAGLFLGEEHFYSPKDYSKSTTLESNQETGIFNEYFIIVDDLKIDELTIKVTYLQDNKRGSKELKLPLIQYACKNKYTFPLKGAISTCSNFNALVDHRQHYSMEFAFDMVQLNVDQKLFFKEDMKKEDHVAYRKEVLAIADGEVMDCYHSFDITTSWVWEEREPYIKEYGFLPAQCGNYIVLKHANGEYSFYGHLDTDSLTVEIGSQVKQGQEIGKLGHTGMSNCPHLHFQLMDGPDFLAARGLPCSFTNIKDICGDPISFIEADNIIVHAE